MVSAILGGMKILLTSSSRHGSTDEVAAVIAERLQAARIDVDIKRPEDVDVVDGYDAFILGSAVYMTKWTPEAVDFTERFHEPLKYVAKLRSMKTDDNILILHMDMDSGHGGATGRYDSIKDTAFEFAFILNRVGIAK